MKRKFADYPNWKKVKERKYVNRYFDDKDFKGNISLLTCIKVKQKIVVDDYGKEILIMDDGFKWMEVYPENHPNIAAIIVVDDKNEIVEWYFDIAKYTGMTEEGVPYIDDLYLDVVVYPSGEIVILDEDELQEALAMGDITKEDVDLAHQVKDYLVEKLDGKVKELTEFTYKYLKLLSEE